MERATIPWVVLVILSTVLVHIRTVEHVQVLACVVDREMMLPFVVSLYLREVPPSPRVAVHSSPTELFGHKIDIVEGTDSSSRGPRENDIGSTVKGA